MFKIFELIDETKDPFFKRGENLGIEKGMTKKTFDVVVNLILKSDHEDGFIASITGLAENTVSQIRDLIGKHPSDFRKRLKDIQFKMPN